MRKKIRAWCNNLIIHNYQLVDNLVYFFYLLRMNSITIGAFEAKTHFSQLLIEVEKGNIIHVTRRGKPIARITSEKFDKKETGQNTLKNISRRRKNINSKGKFITNEILTLRDEGRK